MNLRDWEYFVALAEQQHFGKAALACHVTQPTLSAQLRKLEDYLGVQLLERDQRKVMLTPIGHEMLSRAQRLLAEAEGIRWLARQQRDPLTGDIRMGAFPTLAPYLFPDVLPLMRKALPQLRCFLVEEKTQVLLQQLQAGQLDVALLALPIESAALDVIPVIHEPFYLAVPEKHSLAKARTVALDILQGQTLLLLDEGHCLREQALSLCRLAGAIETAAFRASSLETLRQMVAGGLGITLVPAMAIRNTPGVRYVALQDAPQRHIGLVFRRSDTRTLLWQKMAHILRASDRQNLGPKPKLKGRQISKGRS